MSGRKNLAMRPLVFHLNFLVFVISFVAPFNQCPRSSHTQHNRPRCYVLEVKWSQSH